MNVIEISHEPEYYFNGTPIAYRKVAKVVLDNNDVLVYDALRNGGKSMYIRDYRDDGSRVPAVLSIFTNPPYTTVLWGDGTRTTVKCCDTDTYSEAQGFAAALTKKLFGGKECSSSAVKKFVTAHTKSSGKKTQKKKEAAQ